MKITTWVGTMLTVTLFAVLTNAGGTGRVTGRVVDTATQIPVIGASVFVEGTALHTRTGTDGSYTILNVPAGVCFIRVESAGVVTAKQRVTVIAGQTVTVDFRMTMLSTPRVDAPKVLGEKPAESRLEMKDEALSGRANLSAPTEALRTYAQCYAPPVSWPSAASET